MQNVAAQALILLGIISWGLIFLQTIIFITEQRVKKTWPIEKKQQEPDWVQLHGNVFVKRKP